MKGQIYSGGESDKAPFSIFVSYAQVLSNVCYSVCFSALFWNLTGLQILDVLLLEFHLLGR